MNNSFRNPIMAAWLLSTLVLGLQSCDDPNANLEKSKVQFELAPGSTDQGRMKAIDLPENTTLRISIESSSGTPILSDHEVHVLRSGDAYVTEPLDLVPGTYLITDFMIVKDDDVLNAAPKGKSPFSAFVTHSLPYNFSIAKTGVEKLSMQVLDARNEKPEAFGYASFKVRTNRLSFIVSKTTAGHASLREAYAELRRGKHLINTFSVKPGTNNIAFEGEPDAMYTLSVFAGEMAKVKTFNFKALKGELGAKPLKLALEPALLLTIESGFDEGSDYEEYFELYLGGTQGSVNVNWGDGYENSYTLPLNGSHEYTTGNYTAVITGDLDQITDLFGFAYSTIMYDIRGLTHLTGLRTYNPSWGAVPIKVNLSNCWNLESIYIEKLGGPYYESLDLRTDFQLPEEHSIREFVFYAPSLDITREYISPEELEVFVDNIYNNTTKHSFYGGRFFVYPVETPLPETQQKLDILQNDYNWDVRLDGNIWDDVFESGRTKPDLEVRRENWLRKKFPNSKNLARRAKMDILN